MKMEMISDLVRKLKETTAQPKALVGFDGFIDTIIHVVDKRYSTDNFDRIQHIASFAERIASAANLSTNIEFVTQQIKLGGNGPIMASALLAQNASVSYIGALGEKSIHPIFSEFTRQCAKVVSISEPGYTDAVEFSDGKIMFGKLTQLQNICWNSLQENTTGNELKELVLGANLIAFTNWTMLPDLNSIIVNFGKMLQNSSAKPYLFFDLADPQKRDDRDILELLMILKDLNTFTPVILGLNEKESTIIQSILEINEPDITQRAAKIRGQLSLSFVVIHPTMGAAAATEKEANWVDGPYTKNPKLTTGAGDHFNAGFCNGLLHGLNQVESLVMGVFTSGFYVRNMKSPTLQELIEDIENNAI